eukprot:4083753-Alexandrium_andersonii.AAC.1
MPAPWCDLKGGVTQGPPGARVHPGAQCSRRATPPKPSDGSWGGVEVGEQGGWEAYGGKPARLMRG